jgi:hypothetical protein
MRDVTAYVRKIRRLRVGRFLVVGPGKSQVALMCRLATACVARRCECKRGQSDRWVGRNNDEFRKTNNEYDDDKERKNDE